MLTAIAIKITVNQKIAKKLATDKIMVVTENAPTESLEILENKMAC